MNINCGSNPPPKKKTTYNWPNNGRDPASSQLHLTKREAALELRVGERALDRWQALSTRPKRIRLGRRYYYRRASITELLERLEREGG